VISGNSESQSGFDYGNSVIRLSAELSVLDYFAPQDWAKLNAGDLDLSALGMVMHRYRRHRFDLRGGRVPFDSPRVLR
jgi:hypothetical protein